MNRLLTPADAARILGVAAATVRQMAKRGTLRVAATTPAGNRLFTATDVRALAALRRRALRRAGKKV